MEYDEKKIDEMVLALLYLTSFSDQGFVRAWKGHDWDALDRLHEKGLISDPKSKAKSVVALALLEDVFVKPGGVICPQPYLLRAETYKLLGNMESAAADEESARTLGSPSYCIEY